MASQDWFDRDFYAVLGVPKDADAAAIKRAYRKLARQHHPDANEGQDARFKEVGEAYAVLSDPEQRQQYDAIRSMTTGGARFTAGGPAGGNGFEDLLGGLFGQAGGGPARGGTRVRYSTGGNAGPDLEDLLGGVFGGAGPGQGPGAYGGFRAPRGPRPGPDATATARIGFREALTGATVTVAGPSGSVSARIPPGVRDGQKVRVRGRGGAGEDGGPAGDVVITVQVQPHPVFSRSGDDLKVTLPVTFPEAVLGAEVEVPVLDGAPVRVRVPAGTPSGRVLRVRGRGVQRSGHDPGDLLVTVQVVVPQRLDGDARRAVEAFAAATAGDDPRADLARLAKEG